MNQHLNKKIPIYLANPRGFCAGVYRAIEIVNSALELFGKPIFVHHEVVHNKSVVDDLRDKGAVFVQDLSEVPDGANLIFSAHGVSLAVWNQASDKQLNVFDATCPLVTKVHLQVAKFAKQNYDMILIGHAGHPEVIGTLGQYKNNQGGKIYLVESINDAKNIQINQPNKLAYVSQTTLSVNDTAHIISVLKSRFKNIICPQKEDICYATQNRQNAIFALSKVVDLILVVGSPNSSNSNRLTELAKQLGLQSYLIDNANDIKPEWLKNTKSIGVASGASAPERLVESVIDCLESNYNMICCSEKQRADEKVKFPMPRNLHII